jgi:hypothetical protein
LSFNPESSSDAFYRACRELGLPESMGDRFFGWPSSEGYAGPANRTEFLSRLDAFIAG